jgi:hypothetical protein
MRNPIENFDDFEMCALVPYGDRSRKSEEGLEADLKSVTLERVSTELVPRVLRAKTSLMASISTLNHMTKYNDSYHVYNLYGLTLNYGMFVPKFLTEAEILLQRNAYFQRLKRLESQYADPVEYMSKNIYGGMLYNTIETSSYYQQACSYVLRDDIDASYLLPLMQSSLRWLSDKPAVLATLETIFDVRKEGEEGFQKIDHHANLINELAGVHNVR